MASLASPRNSVASMASKSQPRRPSPRVLYLKVFVGGCFAIIIAIFALFSIYWGSLWKTPAHNLNGWIVDFDGGQIGEQVTQVLSVPSPSSKITWSTVSASQFSSLQEIVNAVLEERTWVAITINPGSSARLAAALSSANSSYDGTQAMTVFATEARQENAFRSFIRPSVQATLQVISMQFALQISKQAALNPNVASILTNSPQTLVAPVSYNLINLVPFDQPVATAVTFVGLIYQLILSFFVVMIGVSAREISGIEGRLTTGRLILLRLGSSFIGYFVISLFYSLLSLAFQLHISNKFGHSGFLVFWMVNYVGMLAVGLALESMVTVLTTRFISFFMITWIITNVSVCIFPIDAMPHIFRYGYGAPFYNVSRAMRTIIFGTKNEVGLNFGILIVWVIISCGTLALFQVLVRRKAISIPESLETDDAAMREQQEKRLAA